MPPNWLEPPLKHLSITHRHHRRTSWPTLGAVAVIAGVVVANGWSLWHASPDLAPMDAMARLNALKMAQDDLASRGSLGALQAAQDKMNAAQLGTPEGALATVATNAVEAALPGLAGSLPGAQLASARADALLGRALPAVRVSTILTAAGVVSGKDGGRAGTTGGLAEATGQNAVGLNGVTRSVVIEPGESLSVALARMFIHGETSRQVVAAFSTLRNPQKLQAGWRLWARFETAGVMDSAALQTLVIAPNQAEGLTIERTDDGFSAHEGGLPGTVVRTALRCGIIGTLEASLRRCGEGDGLVELLQPMLTDRLMQPVELRTGDELRVVVDKLMDGDHVERYLAVEAVEHRSVMHPKDGRTVALRWHGSLYGPDGRGLEPLFLRQPLRVGRQTSNFGVRMHPILHRMKAHLGVDFGAVRGTPVFAAGDGHLVSAERSGGAGNVVRLRHEGGYLTEYMHLQKFVSTLKAGDAVHKGQVVGFVGSTGLSTGPHLHFGVRQHGKYLDPAALTEVVQPSVGTRERATFESETKPLLDMLAALGVGIGDAS